jgi:Transglycosylase SLT domain
MAPLSLLQIADLWLAAGGPRNRVVEWVAIEQSEGGNSTNAVSPAGAIGPWQIMPFNAAPHGYTVADLYNPEVNAKIAVAMSGHGTNCAAWDSCYRNINASGRYSFLGWPESGSSAFDKLGWVSVALGHDKLGGAVPPIGSLTSPQVAKDVAALNVLSAKVYPGLQKLAIAQRMAINRQLVPGWHL